MSLRPSTFSEGGSLLDDVDLTVKEAAFLKYDYKGLVNPPATSLAMICTYHAEDGEKEETIYLSMGSSQGWAPSTDGSPEQVTDEVADYAVEPNGKGLNGNTKLAKFLTSLVNAGFPEDKLDGPSEKASFPASSLIGLMFHMKREAVKYTGLVRTGKNANREQTAITCQKIIKLPWESAPKKAPSLGAPAAKPLTTKAPAAAPSLSKPNGKAAAGPSAEVMAEAQENVVSALMGAGGGPVAKAKLASLVFTQVKGTANQKAIGELVLKDDFLSDIPGLTYEGGQVRITE